LLPADFAFQRMLTTNSFIYLIQTNTVNQCFLKSLECLAPRMNLFLSVHLDAGFEFPRADVILVEIVVVHCYEIAVGVGVVIPAAAVVDYVVDTSDLVFAADAQTYCIIFAVLGGREVDLAEHGYVETAGSAEAVDAEGIVAAVVGGPFLVVDHSRRDGLAVEVGHTVGADNHCAVLLVECVDELLYGGLISIGVVGVELDGELAAEGVVERYVPVAADSVPGLILLDEDEFRIAHELLDNVDGTVGGVVVNDDDVVLIFRVNHLAESRLDSVADGADAVLARDDDGCLVLEAFGRHVDVGEDGFEITVDIFKVLGNSLFHFDLYAAVLRIDVVEELLARLAVVELYVVVEILVDMLEMALLAYFETEVVEASELVVNVHASNCVAEGAGAVEENGTEIEIVAESTELIVDYRSLGNVVAYLVEVVGIHHVGSGILDEAFHTLKSEKHEREGGVLGVNEGIIGRRMCGDEFHVGGGTDVSFEEENLVDELLLLEVFNRLLNLLFGLERNEAVDVFYHNDREVFLGMFIYIYKVYAQAPMEGAVVLKTDAKIVLIF